MFQQDFFDRTDFRDHTAPVFSVSNPRPHSRLPFTQLRVISGLTHNITELLQAETL